MITHLLQDAMKFAPQVSIIPLAVLQCHPE
jgi:hypothetical protein